MKIELFRSMQQCSIQNDNGKIEDIMMVKGMPSKMQSVMVPSELHSKHR